MRAKIEGKDLNSSHTHTYPFALLGKIEQFQNFILRSFIPYFQWIKEMNTNGNRSIF